jgi:replicative DNA helicase
MLLNSLQENLITLLSFSDEQAPIIRGVIDLSLYGGPYRVIASRIYAHLDNFKKSPGDHLPDILSDKLEAKTSEAALYEGIIESIFAAQKGINIPYVMSQLETFVKRQSLRVVAIDLAKALQRDTDESIEEAEKLLASANKQSLRVFDPGVRLSDKKKSLQYLDTDHTAFPTGIPELDKRGFGPTRKELWLLVANSSAGKSWALTQLAKMALMHRLKVCHITLEMSQDRASQRYHQALFAVAKRSDSFSITKFKRDTLGRISGFDDLKIKPVLSFDDPNIRKKLERRIDRWSLRLLEIL